MSKKTDELAQKLISKYDDVDAVPTELPTAGDKAELRLNVHEHLVATCSTMPRRQRNNTQAMHAGASALHGWREHEHHTGARMLLTRKDYCAALAAVDTFKPHQAALSPYKGKGL